MLFSRKERRVGFNDLISYLLKWMVHMRLKNQIIMRVALIANTKVSFVVYKMNHPDGLFWIPCLLVINFILLFNFKVKLLMCLI